jgi:hypothetical protein
MKKKISFAVLVAAVVVWNVNLILSSQNCEMIDLRLADVEAVADCEIVKNGSVKLKCSGINTCSTSYMGYTLTCDGTKQ